MRQIQRAPGAARRAPPAVDRSDDRCAGAQGLRRSHHRRCRRCGRTFRGIVNFHFDSKDNLLAECLRHLSAEYTDNWKTVLAAAEPNAARRLEATLLADFDAELFTPRKLAAWIAFWGEIQGRPVYNEICAARDAEHEKILERLCAEIIAEGGYSHDPATAARVLESLGDGLWLGIGTWRQGTGTEPCPAAARNTLTSALAAYFPNHFRT
jgi:TetR/AcrR family transcriptional repressor of bet genes